MRETNAPGRRSAPFDVIVDWSVWFYAAVLIAVSGASAPVPEPLAFHSAERIALALESAPASSPGARAARASAGEWTGTRPASGEAPPPASLPPQLPTTTAASPFTVVAAPDVPHLSSGFVPDRSLAPPHAS